MWRGEFVQEYSEIQQFTGFKGFVQLCQLYKQQKVVSGTENNRSGGVLFFK